MKVAFIGTHGIGKTTLATRFHLYAIENNIPAKVISEVARDCPLGINDKFNISSAIWIVTEQINRELDSLTRPIHMTICDRSSIDPIMYLQAKLGSLEDSISKGLFGFAESWLETYDKIIWMRPSGREIRDDGVRDVNSKYQKLVDEKFKVQMQKFMKLNPKNIEMIESDSVYNKDCKFLFDSIVGAL